MVLSGGSRIGARPEPKIGVKIIIINTLVIA
jgi:hypothetical protein